jgi:hypothetical protein
MSAPSTKIITRAFDDLYEATQHMHQAWADVDAEQFCLTLEDEGWVLSYPMRVEEPKS